MQRETIPDTKNVISQLKTIKLPFKSNTQRKMKTIPQKDSFSVSAVGQMVKVFDYQLKGRWFKSSHIQKISIGKKNLKNQKNRIFFKFQDKNVKVF